MIPQPLSALPFVTNGHATLYADLKEAEALDHLADTLDALAAVCDAWSIAGCRPLAAALREQGDKASDPARAEFIVLADVFQGTWPTLVKAIKAAQDAMGEGINGDA